MWYLADLEYDRRQQRFQLRQVQHMIQEPVGLAEFIKNHIIVFGIIGIE